MRTEGLPKLEFDLTWDFSQASNGGYIQLGLAVNSSALGGTPESGGYRTLGTGSFINGNNGFDSWPSLGTTATENGVELTMMGATSAHVSVPFGLEKQLSISNPSTYYFLALQTNGAWDGTVDLAVDNIYFSGVPVFEEHTLFSWETPDNPATPNVNEQFEGWMPNPTITPQTQDLSITTTGATDGNYALQIDRTPLPQGFTWGSTFSLDSNGGTNSEVQGQIDDLVSQINARLKLP